MNRDRQTIFSLVAAGRINAEQAERLINASNGAHELFWIAAVLAVVALAPLQGGSSALPHAVHTAIHAAAHTLHHVLTLVVQLIGGRP